MGVVSRIFKIYFPKSFDKFNNFVLHLVDVRAATQREIAAKRIDLFTEFFSFLLSRMAIVVAVSLVLSLLLGMFLPVPAESPEDLVILGLFIASLFLLTCIVCIWILILASPVVAESAVWWLISGIFMFSNTEPLFRLFESAQDAMVIGFLGLFFGLPVPVFFVVRHIYIRRGLLPFFYATLWVACVLPVKWSRRRETPPQPADAVLGFWEVVSVMVALFPLLLKLLGRMPDLILRISSSF